MTGFDKYFSRTVAIEEWLLKDHELQVFGRLPAIGQRFQESYIQGHIGFINYKGPWAQNSQITRFDQVIDTTRCSDNDMLVAGKFFFNLTRLIRTTYIVN